MHSWSSIVLPLLFGSAILVGCGGEEAPGEPPEVKLRVAGHVDLGRVLVLDGAGTTDPDGDILEYRFIIADGSGAIVTSEPRVTHAFQIAGWIEVRLVVFDRKGNSGESAARVSVRRP